jgi:hypothetical protein
MRLSASVRVRFGLNASSSKAAPTAGAKGGAVVHLLRKVEFDPIEARPRQVTHEVRFLGPAQGWSVVRLSDGKPVAENCPDRDTAESHLVKMTPTRG